MPKTAVQLLGRVTNQNISVGDLIIYDNPGHRYFYPINCYLIVGLSRSRNLVNWLSVRIESPNIPLNVYNLIDGKTLNIDKIGKEYIPSIGRLDGFTKMGLYNHIGHIKGLEEHV